MDNIKLYKRSKTGKSQEWSIEVINGNDGTATIVSSSGYCGMEITNNFVIISKGCNLGKKNEKTSYELAVTKAEKKIKDKLEDNWHTSIHDIDNPIEYIKPMLAETFVESKLVLPCYVQPKMNGVRVSSYRHINDDTVWSRERNEYVALDKIKNGIDIYFGKYSPDGEGYNPDLTFQEIISAVKKKNENTDSLKLWVYDLAIPNVKFSERLKILDDIFLQDGIDDVFYRVPTILCTTLDEIEHWHDEFVKMGFEGLIIRTIDDFYVFNDRTFSLMKFKKFQDCEFKIINFSHEVWFDVKNNIYRKLVIWKCITKDGKEFDVRPSGSFIKREAAYKTAQDQINKQYTVKFQNYSDEGVPIFPIGVAIRDYE